MINSELENNNNEIDEIKEYIDDLENIIITNLTTEFIIIKDLNLDRKLRIDKDFFENNDTLLKQNEKLKYFENRGFKLGNYVEVFLDYYQVLNYDNNSELNDFKIGDVNVRISQPTDLFKIILYEAASDEYFSHDYTWTMSLTGITENNYEEYLNNAIFLLGYYNPSIFYYDYPSTYEFLGENFNSNANDSDDVQERRLDKEEFDNRIFCKIKHHEALSFYNAAMNIYENEISFIFFYRVLEHFFLFVRENEFIRIIEEYNKFQRIDNFIENVTKIYSNKEEFQLLNLLETIKNDIKQVICEAKDKRIIFKSTVEEFSNKLYSYRNSIVHGKNDSKLFVKIPRLINDSDEMFWNKTVKNIAEILILKYQ